MQTSFVPYWKHTYKYIMSDEEVNDLELVSIIGFDGTYLKECKHFC
jgi:hypothetical protein